MRSCLDILPSCENVNIVSCETLAATIHEENTKKSHERGGLRTVYPDTGILLIFIVLEGYS